MEERDTQVDGTKTPELLVDFITSLDGYGAAEGWPGWWGLQGPEYLAWFMDGDGRHARLLVEGGRYTTWPRFSPDGTTVSYANDEMLEIVDVASGEVTTLDASTHEADPAWYDDDTLIVD